MQATLKHISHIRQIDMVSLVCRMGPMGLHRTRDGPSLNLWYGAEPFWRAWKFNATLFHITAGSCKICSLSLLLHSRRPIAIWCFLLLPLVIWNWLKIKINTYESLYEWWVLSLFVLSMPCKARRQYLLTLLLTLQVSRHCLLDLQITVKGPREWLF